MYHGILLITATLKVQTPINRAARGCDSASREGRVVVSKVRCAILVSTTCLLATASLSRTDFSRAVSRPRSPVRAAATRGLDEMHPWLAPGHYPVKPGCRWRIGLGSIDLTLPRPYRLQVPLA